MGQTLPSPSEGGGERMVGPGCCACQCRPVARRVSGHGTHSRRVGFACPCLASLAQNITSPWSVHRGHSQEGILQQPFLDKVAAAGFFLAVVGGLCLQGPSSLFCFCLPPAPPTTRSAPESGRRTGAGASILLGALGPACPPGINLRSPPPSPPQSHCFGSRGWWRIRAHLDCCWVPEGK